MGNTTQMFCIIFGNYFLRDKNIKGPMKGCKESDLQPKDGVTHCPLCKKDFGVFLWKYNCHCCGMVHCDDCCSNSYKLPPRWREPVRVCKDCDTKRTSSTTSDSVSSPAVAVIARQPSETLASNTSITEDGKRTNPALEAALRRQQSKNTKSVRPAPVAAKSQQQPAHQQPAQQQPAQQQPALQQPAPSKVVVKSSDEELVLGSDLSPVEVSNRALEAALRRQQSTQLVTSSSGDSEKMQLLLTIQKLLQKKKQDEPFGLRSMDSTKLRMYLNHLQNT